MGEGVEKWGYIVIESLLKYLILRSSKDCGDMRVAVTKKGRFFIVFAVVVPILLIGLLIVNWFVYPFVSAKPNFADVEAVYNKMVVPADWVKKGEGSNKGIAGRQCPIESDGCFSKAATFSVPTGTTEEVVKDVFKSLGCVSVSTDTNTEKNGPTTTTFRCSAGELIAVGSLLERDGRQEMYVNVGTD